MKQRTRCIVCFALSVALILSFANVILAEPAEDQSGTAMEIKGKAALLIDNATGQVIYENNSEAPLPIAGVTKVMSMLLFFEAVENGKIQLKDNINISKTAAGMGGSQAFLDAGADYTVETLIKAVVVANANDACVALAEAVSGSEETFVAEMNQRAQDLNMSGTKFINSTGLYADGHVSTAKDIVAVSRELVKHRQLFEYSSTWMDSITHSQNRVSELTNGNRLVKSYAGCDGLATGSDNKAGYCISATAMRGNLRLVAIVLGADNNRDRMESTQKMLDYGFANFTAKRIYKQGDTIKKDIPVKSGLKGTINGVTGQDYSLLLEKGQERAINKEVIVEEDLSAPVKAGQKIGIVIIKANDQELLRVDILAQEDVEKIDFKKNLKNIFDRWLLGA